MENNVSYLLKLHLAEGFSSQPSAEGPEVLLTMLAPGDEVAKCDKPDRSRWDAGEEKEGQDRVTTCLNLTSVTT